MREEPIDPRIDKMMAALYGELTESEERAFQRLLEKDEDLRREWEELQGIRHVLGEWEVEERVPSFVLVGGEEKAAERRGAPAAPGLLERLADSLRGIGMKPAWGLSLAAVALLTFWITNARVDGEIERLSDQLKALQTMPAGLGQELALDSQEPVNAGDGKILQASGTYLTREEYDSQNEQFMANLVSVLNDYGHRRDEEMGTVVQTMYEKLSQQQSDDYRVLNNRMEALGMELLVDRARSREILEQLGAESPDGAGRELRTEPTGDDTEE